MKSLLLFISILSVFIFASCQKPDYGYEYEVKAWKNGTNVKFMDYRGDSVKIMYSTFSHKITKEEEKEHLSFYYHWSIMDSLSMKYNKTIVLN